MTKKIIYLYIFLNFLPVFSQNQSNIWYFGFNAGLDFNNGAPVALDDGITQTVEGTAVIADNSGQLLFYTDGLTVWDKNHNIMPNGAGLLSNQSSTQAALIVPVTDSETLYYIFITPEEGNGAARYSVVDMSLNNGLGAVTAEKNIILLDPSCEKITAVKKPDNSYWVVFHYYGSNNFYSYSVSSAGLSTTPVISSAGSSSSNPGNAMGQMKFSPDGTKLICANYNDKVELFDFDINTGIVSNPQTIFETQTGILVNYGVEFSPSGNLVYLTTGPDSYPSVLYQLDLTAEDVVSSAVILHEAESVSDQLGALQLAKDGKVYMAIAFSGYVSAITNPDVPGLGCGFVLQSVALGEGHYSGSGLPQYIQSYFFIGINYDNTCLGQETSFSLPNTENITSVQWDFGDGETSTSISPVHIYSQAGTYTVSVTATGSADTQTNTRQITISEIPIANEVVDKVVCSNENDVYDLTQNITEILGEQDDTVYSVSYHESIEDAELNSNPLEDETVLPLGDTEIFARIYNNNNPLCFATTSFTITKTLQPVANEVADYIICENLPYDNAEEFDLNSKNTEVLGNQQAGAFTVSYHSSQEDSENNTNPLPLFYTNTNQQEELFVRIQNIANPSCYAVTSFTVAVVQQPIANEVSDFIVCDDQQNDGITQFDLSQKDSEMLGSQSPSLFEVFYYISQADAEAGVNPISSPYTNTINNQEIFAAVKAMGNDGCKDISSFTLVVTMTPQINEPEAIFLCDDTVNDGIATLDFSVETELILDGQTGFSVSYYESETDASNQVNALGYIYQNTANPQTIFVRVQNDVNPDCFVLDSFEVEVMRLPIAYQPDDMYGCSDDVQGDTAVFNLQDQNEQILNNQQGALEVLYYLSYIDAQTQVNEVNTVYGNTTNPQTIYARVSNTITACYSITSFQLNVFSKPLIEMNDIYSFCEEEGLFIEAPAGFDSYQWDNRQTTRRIYIDQPGDYTLTVSKDYGAVVCTSSKTVQAVNSGIATITAVEIQDWSDNNNAIAVQVQGNGEYEFSLDGISYQDSPFFEGLETGDYSVHVRDKNGCGVAVKDIWLLMYPKYFTPNGDGSNEIWRIRFSRFEADLEVTIFDRYGKIITGFKGNDLGWDGTYNGMPLPASDYWFVVHRSNGKIYKGHFSLIR